MRLRFVLACLLAVALRAPADAAQPACPGAATVEVYVENRSADAALTVDVAGELVAAAATCDGAGSVAYAQSLGCNGTGLVHCGTITGLRPGAWVNHVAATVTGSDPQVQHRRAVFVASTAPSVQTLLWTVYPRTFVVADSLEGTFRSALASAASYTAASSGPALVTFSATAFPGGGAPQSIDLSDASLWPAPCLAGTPRSALCFAGSRVVVDALDAAGNPGGVVLSVKTRTPTLSVLRVSGAENVFRGLVFEGTQVPNPGVQRDTVTFSGSGARRNRLEACVVRGPTSGDAVSADAGAGGATLDESNAVVECELTGAADKGLKVTGAAYLHLTRSCVHDNVGGGVQATLSGHLNAVENVVQHDVPGKARGEIIATGNNAAAPSTVTTNGNIVRFAGGRGLSVVDGATGVFQNDYVADNQFSGATIETTDSGPLTTIPAARFRGVAFVCNHNAGVSGTCQPNDDDAIPCATNADCAAPLHCGLVSFPNGYGLVQNAASGHATPAIDAGDAGQPGRNAFALNAKTAVGANVALKVPDSQLAAVGDQWEHCGANATCDVSAIQAGDLRLAGGATVQLGAPTASSTGTPVATEVSPARPARGDLVRVFGDGFDAIVSAKCAGQTSPESPCSAANAAVRDEGRRNNANRVRLFTVDNQLLTLPDGSTAIYPDAVTPTMIAFYMPFDCFAPLVLEVSKKSDSGATVAATIDFCRPLPCDQAPAGLPCDDLNACTANDRCDEAHACTGTPITCDGSCRTGVCNPATGCVLKPNNTICRPAAGGCDVDERCNGTDPTCPADALRLRGFVCRPSAGICDPEERCDGTTPVCPADAKSTAVCRPVAGVCDVEERCDGVGAACPTDGVKAAGVQCRAAAGVCDVAESCTGSSATCPADAKSTAVCRPAVGVCDVAESCDGAGNACPGDAFASTAVVCRASINQCDAAESCTGTGPSCPANRFLPNGTACDDGNACTTADHCETGSCLASDPLVCPACEACAPDVGCVVAPRTDCRAPVLPSRSELAIATRIKKRVTHALTWTWGAGAQTLAGDFGDVTSERYAFCVYDDSATPPTIAVSAEVPAGASCGARPCWRAFGKPSGARGYRYADSRHRFDGVQAIQLKPGVDGKARVVVKARGSQLAIATPLRTPFQLPLRVQLQSQTGACWESTFSGAVEKNDGLVFRGKSD